MDEIKRDKTKVDPLSAGEENEPARPLETVPEGQKANASTAVIPGKKSPVLVTKEMVKGMAPGSVIFDLAAERGGNCELTEAGQTVVKHGVTIIGAINVASGVPYHASQMYARNVTAFLTHLIKDQKLQLNIDDEIVHDTLVTHGGEIVNTRVREFFAMPPLLVVLSLYPAGNGCPARNWNPGDDAVESAW